MEGLEAFRDGKNTTIRNSKLLIAITGINGKTLVPFIFLLDEFVLAKQVSLHDGFCLSDDCYPKP